VGGLKIGRDEDRKKGCYIDRGWKWVREIVGKGDCKGH